MNNQIIVSSLFWKFLERIGVQAIQFIIQIILARLISPSEYGILAILTIFISIATVFIESGFNLSLLQKKDVTNIDYDTSFVSCLSISIIVYALLFITAPIISDFYGIGILKQIIRISSVILIIGAYNSIQISRISREMQFKKLFICSLLSVIISGIIGIILALFNFGVWALVAQQIIQKLSLCIIMTIVLKWIPRLKFSKEKFNQLFSFGIKILISNLINTIYNNIYGLVIGKVYSSKMLGFYNRADQFPNIIVNNINGSLQTVMLPVLSSEQDNKQKIKVLMRNTIKLSSYIVFPLMFGLLACSELVVKVVLTDKWLPSVPFLQLLCLIYALYPIHTVNLQAINALGRSDIYLKLEIIKKIVGILFLCITIPKGIYVMVSTQLLIGIISSFINAYPNKYLLNYKYSEQIKDVFPALFSSIIMAIIIIIFNNFIFISHLLNLIFSIFLGILIYFGLSKILKIDEINKVEKLIKGVLKYE